MKKLIVFLSLLVALEAAATAPPEINEKVLKAFKETFAKATDVVWHEMKNSYLASFKQSEITTRATYDTEGNLLRTTRYYSEENLPVHILTRLKKKYSDKSIYGVTEMTQGDEVAYFVTLQDAKNWYMVKADNWGGLELTKKYRKA